MQEERGGGGVLDIFTLVYPISPSLWETVRYRLKYCLKGLFYPKQSTNQPIQGRRFDPHSHSSGSSHKT